MGLTDKKYLKQDDLIHDVPKNRSSEKRALIVQILCFIKFL